MGLIEDAISRRGKQQGGSTRQRRPIPQVADGSAHPKLDQAKRIDPDEAHLLENRIICESMDRAAIGAYKMLRTRVAQALKSKGWSSIGIAACRSGEGKTLVAINLALSLATNPNQRVFLVDLDLRRPTLAERLDVTPEKSLAQMVQDGSYLENLMQFRDLPLYLLLNNEKVLDSSEVLASAGTSRMVEAIRRLGGIVIYDLPPLLAADDFLAFSANVDCALLIASERETQRADLVKAREMLQDTNLLGVVLNKSHEPSLVDSYYY